MTLPYLLVNDTSRTNNPGCRGTIACLRELLRGIDLQEVGSLPLGFGQELFVEVVRKGYQSRSWSWNSALRKLNRRLAPHLADVDVVVINAEGTIHHNRPSACALLGVAEIAKESGLRVALVNGTIQEMSEAALQRSLPMLDWLMVREKRSLEYLYSIGISAEFAPDCLFTYWSSITRTARLPGDRLCLYTPGVLGLSGELKEDDISAHLNQISQAGFSCTYLVAEVEDERFVEVAKGAGADIIGMAEVPWFGLPKFLSAFSLVVSGRYHMALFAWLAGVPVIPLSSNTWKMEGLFNLVEDTKGVEVSCSALNNRISQGGALLAEEELSSMEIKCRSEFFRLGEILSPSEKKL